MTVSSITPVNNYTGNSSAKIFDFDFLIENQEELQVVHTNSEGVLTTPEFGVDYSINEIGNENGSYITFPLEGSNYNVLSDEEIISLSLTLPIKQESEFENSANLNLNILERTFDYIVRILQIMNRKIDRSVKINEGSSVTPDEMIENLQNCAQNAKSYAESSSQKSQESFDSAELAKLWATLLGSKVNDEDYSSKYYAQQAQSFANLASNVKDEIVQSGMYKNQLFDIIMKDRKLTYAESFGFAQLGTYVHKEAIAGERYGYPDFYAKCLAEYNEATGTEIVNDITIKVHSNGHKYFDIADKETVDKLYQSNGIAWYYGIDSENERVFLPRNDYYFKNGNAENVGEYIEAGLPNFSGGEFASMKIWADMTISAPFYSIESTTSSLGSSGATYYTHRIGLDPSLSNSIYGNSDTVQPPSVSVIPYMVVGNTTSENAITNVIDITTTENDTLPLFYNTYSNQDMTESGSFVNASLGSYLSGNIYTTAYARIESLGIGATFGAGTIKAYGDESITDYDLVLKDDNMTFRLPLLNGERVLVEKKEATDDDPTWYNLYSDGWLEQGGMAGPWYRGAINVLTFEKAFKQKPTFICDLEVTNGEAGEILSTIGNSNNNSGVQFVTTTQVTVKIVSISGSGTDGGPVHWTAYGYTEIPTGINLYYKLNNVVQNQQILDVAGVTSDLNTKISKTECAAYVVETSNKSLLPSWYRVWSDGWCEQGGQTESMNNGSTLEIALLKSYSNTNYQCQITGYCNGSASRSIIGVLQTRTADSMVIQYTNASDNVAAALMWQTGGYIN